MLRSERQSLYRFMMIYVLSTMLLFVGGAMIFYKYEQSRVLTQQQESLKQEALRLMPEIKSANLEKIQGLKDLNIAVYNGKKSYLFGNFKPKDLDWTKRFSMKEKRLRYSMLTPPPHRRHVAFIVIEKKINDSEMPHLKRTIIMAVSAAFVMVLLLGYFLGRLFMAPMRKALQKINLFVQDTTHELNTPVSTILTNIEMIELLEKCPHSEEMERIKIASHTLSRIYDDLSYLRLNETYERQIEAVDLSVLLEERLTYFASLMRAKQITLGREISEAVIQEMDRTDAVRLFDNLISNAIKYNNVGGTISVSLGEDAFEVRDSGRGMDVKMQKRAFERFERGDKSEGGFGIGLDIVSHIVQHYGYDVTLQSAVGNGTTVTVRWNRARG